LIYIAHQLLAQSFKCHLLKESFLWEVLLNVSELITLWPTDLSVLRLICLHAKFGIFKGHFFLTGLRLINCLHFQVKFTILYTLRYVILVETLLANELQALKVNNPSRICHIYWELNCIHGFWGISIPVNFYVSLKVNYTQQLSSTDHT